MKEGERGREGREGKKRKEGGRKERGEKRREKKSKKGKREWERERERTVEQHPEVCLADCEPGNGTERCLSDITGQHRCDELDRGPRWAGELVHCMAAGVVRCQEQLSSLLRRGVDGAISQGFLSLLGLADKWWGCLSFIQHKLGWKDDRR